MQAIAGTTLVQQAGMSLQNYKAGLLPHGWLECVNALVCLRLPFLDSHANPTQKPTLNLLASPTNADPALNAMSLAVGRYYDEKHGRAYFFNVHTKKCTWKPPRTNPAAIRQAAERDGFLCDDQAAQEDAVCIGWNLSTHKIAVNADL